MGFAVKKITYTHEALADLVITNPHLTKVELAAIFDKSYPWIVYVMNSDAFLLLLAERREKFIDPALQASLNERLSVLARTSVDVVMAKISNTPPEFVDKDFALKAMAVATKALGYGASNTNINAVQQNTYVVALPGAAQSDEAWVAAYGGKQSQAPVVPSAAEKDIIDVECVERVEHVEVPSTSSTDGEAASA